MSATDSSPQPDFTAAELDLLAKTADALSAYTGKPVMAEAGQTEGVAWVVFGVPLATDENEEDQAIWQMGGEDVRPLGNAGGLAPAPDAVYACRLLWAIQVTPNEGERFIKLDEHGAVVGWSDRLADLLPFDIDPEQEWDDDDDEEYEEEDDGPGPPRRGH